MYRQFQLRRFSFAVLWLYKKKYFLLFFNCILFLGWIIWVRPLFLKKRTPNSYDCIYVLLISTNLFKTRIDQEYVHLIRNWHNILKEFYKVCFVILNRLFCYSAMSRYMKNQSCRWKGFCYNITSSWNNEIPSSDRVILQILEAYYLQFNA